MVLVTAALTRPDLSIPSSNEKSAKGLGAAGSASAEKSDALFLRLAIPLQYALPVGDVALRVSVRNFGRTMHLSRLVKMD